MEPAALAHPPESAGAAPTPIRRGRALTVARASRPPLGTHHLAFLRAILQGIPLEKAAEHYLFGDLKRTRTYCRSLLRQLHAELVQVGALAGKPHLVAALPLERLLRHAQAADARDVSDPKLPANALSFDEYCAEQPDGFFTASELKREYQDYLNALTGKTAEKAVSTGSWDVVQALRALEILAPLLAAQPRAEHPLEGWLHAPIAQRFDALGLKSLGDVVAFINRHGYRWHSRITGFGRKRAAAMARWIRDNGSGAGALTTVANQPRSMLTSADLHAVREGRGCVVPFEAIVLPVALDGVAGSNRERRRVCQVSAAGDRDAIERWLHAGSSNANTLRAYSREAERVLQWCVYEKGKPLSSMTVEDCIEYREFLVGLPDPAAPWHWQTRRADWIGAKSHPRSSPNWRPFEGRMSQQSIERSLTIVRGMFTWLTEQAYLAGNPWQGIKLQLSSHERFRHRAQGKSIRDRALGEAEWECLLALADSLQGEERRARARVIVRLAGQAGLRRDELAHVSTANLKLVMLEDGTRRYLLALRGKGGVERAVPLTRALTQCLSEYLASRGLPSTPEQCEPDTPLIAALTSERTTTPRLSAPRIYTIVKRLIQYGASGLQAAGRTEEARHMNGLARAHTLRHTFGTMAAEKNLPAVVQSWMGHSDVKTTMGYFSPRADVQFKLLDETFDNPAVDTAS